MPSQKKLLSSFKCQHPSENRNLLATKSFFFLRKILILFFLIKNGKDEISKVPFKYKLNNNVQINFSLVHERQVELNNGCMAFDIYFDEKISQIFKHI